MPSLRTKTLAVAAVAGALVAGSTATADAAGTRPGVPVHVVTTNTVVVPATMQPGRVRFHNTGRLPLYVFEKRHAGIGRLVHDLNDSASASGPGRLTRDFALLDIITGHAYVYLPLTRGTYYFTDAVLDHYRAADIRTVNVHGKTHNAKAPASRRLTVVPGGTLTAPATLPRTRYLHVENRTGRLQEVAFFGLGTDVTNQQIADFLAAPSFEKLIGLHFTAVGDVAVLAGHHDLWTHGPHRAGRYLLLTLSAASQLPSLRKDHVRLLTVP